MAPNGTLARQTDRVFADLGGPESGVPDGVKVDSAGNVYCGGAGGIYILDAKGSAAPPAEADARSCRRVSREAMRSSRVVLLPLYRCVDAIVPGDGGNGWIRQLRGSSMFNRRR